MTLEVISSEQAFGHARTNAFSKYPRPDSGSERLFPFPSPACEATFQIPSDAKIFTMGSCFAREVDRALSSVGFTVTSRTAELDQTVERSGKDESLYNKYIIHSILNEIKWALDPDAPYPGKAALLQVGEDRWEDPQLGGDAFNGSLKNMLAFRESYCRSMKQIAEADVVIITLGLVEAWFDKESNLYLNGAPPIRLAKSNPERFELRVLDYNEITEALEEIYKLLSRFGKQDVRFLVTVSPVPLLSTFRAQDVLVANTYSKSVQRAAVERFVLNHSNVNYFPSYEFVALGDPNRNWAHDYRHVHPAVVRRIMSSVMLNYTPNDSIRGSLVSSEINAAYAAKDYLRVMDSAQTVGLDLIQLVPLYRVGLSYKKLGFDKEALETFELCVKKDEKFQAALENAIGLSFKLKNAASLKEHLSLHERVFPENVSFRKKFSI